MLERLGERICPSAPPGNLPPSIESITFNLAAPTTSQVLTVEVHGATDADNDPITLQYEWFVNGASVQTTSSSSLTASLDLGQPGFGDSGDTMAVFVTPMDPYQSGAASSISVAVANSAPHIVGPGSLTSMAGDSISVQIQATDPDDDSLVFSAAGLPDGVSINSATGLIDGTISSGASTSESYAVTISVTDGDASANVIFDWVVNEAYVVVIQGDQVNVAGETVSVSLYTWHAPNHSVIFSADGLPSGLSIDSSSGDISGTIDFGTDASSPYSVTITATDNAGAAWDSVSFHWHVEAPQAIIFGPWDLESVIGATVELPIAAFHTGAGSLTYGANGLPPGVSIASDTGTISGTVAGDADTSNHYLVTITASDIQANISASLEITWIVRHLVLLDPGPQADLVGTTVNVRVTAAYAESGILIFGAAGLPAGLTIDDTTGLITGTIASEADELDPYLVTLTVSDGIFSASTTFSWEVKKLFFASVNDQYGIDTDSVSLELSVSSLAGHTITYDAVGLPAGLTINPMTGTISGTIAEGAHLNGPFVVTITATDSAASASVSNTLTWNVDWRNQPIPAPPVDPNPYQPLTPTPAEIADGEAGSRRFLLREMRNAEARRARAEADLRITNLLLPEILSEIGAAMFNNPTEFIFDETIMLHQVTLQTLVRDRGIYGWRIEQMNEYIDNINSLRFALGWLV